MQEQHDTYQRIVESAQELIYASSYADVGVAAICEKAEVKKGSFYHFFPSKQALTLVVIDGFFTRLKTNALDELDAADLPPLEKIETLFRKIMQLQVKIHGQTGQIYGCPLGNLATEMATQDEAIRSKLLARHGREDFTITPQQEMMDTLSSVLDVLTFAVGALGGISLLVGGVGILTIMTISVTERTSEIGLLRALGAKRGQVLSLFLGEAILLSSTGGVLGLSVGIGIAQLLTIAVPALPVNTPWLFVVLAETVAVTIGLAAGVVPATRAARLDLVEALRAE